MGEFVMLSDYELDQISYKSSLERNLRKIQARDIDSPTVNIVLRDLIEYRRYLTNDRNYAIIKKVSYRIKSRESVLSKFERYRGSDRDLRGILNDLLGIRIIISDYTKIGDYGYLRKVDMTQGKNSNDDGYRGIHFYYQKSPLHYQIEIQVWSEHDELFNIWAHDNIYKTDADDVGSVIRDSYDRGRLKTAKDFTRALMAMREDGRL